ncbi:MAG: rod shape-determining protein RodA [Gemmatimonadota bacterium]|nr:MAG: rod shape-determining protein RodA [Gemmatimonadota bacterium]
MERHNLDKALVALVVVLMGVGLATLYSAGQTDVPSSVADIWKRQLIWIGLGVVGALAAFRFSPRLLEWVAPAFYGFAILLLIWTLFFGVGGGTASATKSWIGIFGVRLGQPAEVAKLATILMLARILGARRHPPAGIWEALPAGIVAGIPFALVALQPDLGSAIVFIAILFGALYWAGLKPSLLLLLLSPGISLLLSFSTWSWGIWIVCLTLFVLWMRPYILEGLSIWFANAITGAAALTLWERLQPYQQRRLLSFLDPDIDPRATGWHIIQSKIAVGSGGAFGVGYLEGTQKRLAFLPAQHTDFIYSVVGEELGFLGVLVTLSLFAAVIFVLLRVARKANDPFSSMVVAGVAIMLLTHTIVNIGMTIGLMPITGIPLPFFSYGGSFMLTCCISIGLVLRVSWEAHGLRHLNV